MSASSNTGSASPSNRPSSPADDLPWGARAALTAVYADRGITSGMRQGIARARAEGRRVEFRYIETPEP